MLRDPGHIREFFPGPLDGDRISPHPLSTGGGVGQEQSLKGVPKDELVQKREGFPETGLGL